MHTVSYLTSSLRTERTFLIPSVTLDRYPLLEKGDIASLVSVLSLIKYPGNYSTDSDKRTWKANRRRTG